MLCQIVPELLHLPVVNALQWSIGNRMKTDEVDAAVQSFEQAHDGLGMSFRVVYILEDNVFERQTSLVREVIIAQQIDNALNRHSPFCRHQFRTLFMKRRVHADGDMTVALLKETLQLAFDAHAAHRDALGRPSIAEPGSQYLRHTQYIVEVVHRFALPHEDDVRQLVTFRKRIDLVENICCREAALKALFPRLAEEAVHLASYLRGDTQCGAAILGYIDCLDELAAVRREEVFDCSVLGILHISRFLAADGIRCRQLLPVCFRDIRHLVNALHLLCIKPFSHLSTRESRHTERLCDLFQLAKCHPQQILLRSLHTCSQCFVAAKITKKKLIYVLCFLFMKTGIMKGRS